VRSILAASTSAFSGSQSDSGRVVALRRGARLSVTLLGLLLIGWGLWTCGRAGLAQLLASYAVATRQLDIADKATRVGPTVPETHYVRAALLADAGEWAEAAKEYERAVALRPRDYSLWLELGRARDQADDTTGAVAAFAESVRLAPFYAQPRWQLGNTLYRLGRRDEAFAQLQRATVSDPKLLPQALALAWAAYGGDAQAVVQSLEPQTDAMRLALARFLAAHGKAQEAVAQFRAARNVSADERRALLTDLLTTRRFAEAYAVWSSGHGAGREASAHNDAAIINGGFESPVSLNDPGFDWQLAQNLSAVEAAQDRAEPHGGAQSLRLAWSGNANTSAPVISQLVLVEPNARYQLRLTARTQELITAGLPQIVVSDAGDERTLGAALTLPQGTSDWRDYTIEFATGATTSAVRISLRRQDCNTAPCPIFGRVWLDDVSVRKM